MGFSTFTIVLLFTFGFVGHASADDRLVRLGVHPALEDSGLMKYLLPRFSLKTQIRVQVVATGDAADATFDTTGPAIFKGDGAVWSLTVLAPEHSGTAKFADWISSDAGHRAITGFTRDGHSVFAIVARDDADAKTVVVQGDAVEGRRLAIVHCGRCHVSTADDPMRGIGSTPSFSVVRALDDWEARFSSFFALKPHPVFTQVEDVTEPFAPERPPPIVPIKLTLDGVEAILAYVSTLAPADLGAPLMHQ